jgi:hypothetical protein
VNLTKQGKRKIIFITNIIRRMNDEEKYLFVYGDMRGVIHCGHGLCR